MMTITKLRWLDCPKVGCAGVENGVNGHYIRDVIVMAISTGASQGWLLTTRLSKANIQI